MQYIVKAEQKVRRSVKFQNRKALIFLMVLGFFVMPNVSSAQEPTGAVLKEGSGSNADREWAKRNTKLNILETKINDLTKQLQYLIKVKNEGGIALDEKGRPIDVLANIASSHKKLKETVEDYNREKEELRFRYPEEGAVLDRRYVPMRLQTLEQIERTSGLDGELTQTKKKIDKKYANFIGDEFVKPEPKPTQESTIQNEKINQEKESKRIHLSQ